jgi:antitoxin component YwqK of YwqJK toxin-antitoxin module
LIVFDSIACPKGSTFKTWKDGYTGEEKKYTAYGCKNPNGDRVGFHIAWRDYGVKEHEGSFELDVPSGEWTYYHANGVVKSRGNFVDGEKDGTWNYWYENGDLKIIKVYDNGEVVDEEWN